MPSNSDVVYTFEPVYVHCGVRLSRVCASPLLSLPTRVLLLHMTLIDWCAQLMQKKYLFFLQTYNYCCIFLNRRASFSQFCGDSHVAGQHIPESSFFKSKFVLGCLRKSHRFRPPPLLLPAGETHLTCLRLSPAAARLTKAPTLKRFFLPVAFLHLSHNHFLMIKLHSSIFYVSSNLTLISDGLCFPFKHILFNLCCILKFCRRKI
jgi:hypothetical protein